MGYDPVLLLKYREEYFVGKRRCRENRKMSKLLVMLRKLEMFAKITTKYIHTLHIQDSKWEGKWHLHISQLF